MVVRKLNIVIIGASVLFGNFAAANNEAATTGKKYVIEELNGNGDDNGGNGNGNGGGTGTIVLIPIKPPKPNPPKPLPIY